MIFADSELNSSGEWELILAEDIIRVLPFEGCSIDDCTARVDGGRVPPTDDYDELDLVRQFMDHRMVLFLYWVDGEEMRASTTLSGFQAQFPEVLE
ncbi:MAG: hypothetical protein IIC78_07365 [Chloroflexi bacterium]|nr:hypothetical protein [Chloroflexota bacterium]